MYRLSANSRATISSTAIFLSQQSRQYFSSPRGSETSLAPHSAQRDCATDLRGICCHCTTSQRRNAQLPINRQLRNSQNAHAKNRPLTLRKTQSFALLRLGFWTMRLGRLLGLVELWSCGVVELSPRGALPGLQRGRVHAVHIILDHAPRAEARRH